MAIEARRLNLHPQFSQRNNQGNMSLFNTQMNTNLPLPATMPENLQPFYQSVVGGDSVPAKTSLKDANNPRKRGRDYSSSIQQPNKFSGFPLLDADINFQIQQQQSEFDLFLNQHNGKLRFQIEEERKRQSRILVSSVYGGMAKKLKEKDEEIQRIGKLNWALQEKIKTLLVENQIWRDLAQSNEATANSLRCNLEQVLMYIAAEDRRGAAAPAKEEEEEEDAESCCGSCDSGAAAGGGGNKTCRNCGEKESCVLVLPCRHLCLCTTCGSTLHFCPVCNSVMNASLHLNLS